MYARTYEAFEKCVIQGYQTSYETFTYEIKTFPFKQCHIIKASYNSGIFTQTVQYKTYDREILNRFNEHMFQVMRTATSID